MTNTQRKYDDRPTMSLVPTRFHRALRDTLATQEPVGTRRTSTRPNATIRRGQFVGLFVKNLENVQGDERDVIIVSVCYGPDPAAG